MKLFNLLVSKIKTNDCKFGLKVNKATFKILNLLLKQTEH